MIIELAIETVDTSSVSIAAVDGISAFDDNNVFVNGIVVVVVDIVIISPKCDVGALVFVFVFATGVGDIVNLYPNQFYFLSGKKQTTTRNYLRNCIASRCTRRRTNNDDRLWCWSKNK